MSGTLTKLCVNSFLGGLVFWYGFDKLYMQNIVGITAAGIGIAVAVLQSCNTVLDIFAGWVADRWSRKGVLMIAALAMVGCSLTMGLSHSLQTYLVGVVLYAINVVCTSGTGDSLLHDELESRHQTDRYTKLGGRMGSLYTFGTRRLVSVAASWRRRWGYRSVFLVTAGLAVVNLLVVASIREPNLHRQTKQLSIVQTVKACWAIASTGTLLTLVVVMSLVWVSEAFKEGLWATLHAALSSDAGPLLGQIWLTVPLALTVLWALFYLVWGVGELVSHWFDDRIGPLVWFTVLPLVAMSLLDGTGCVGAVHVQAIASSACFIQINAGSWLSRRRTSRQR